MRSFAQLYASLDETNKTSAKVEALARYFSKVSADDGAWSVYFLSGRRPRQVVPSKRLREWAQEWSQVSDWLFDETYRHVGDLAETIALLLPPPSSSTDLPLTHWVEDRLFPLAQQTEHQQKQAVREAWECLERTERLVWNKLITGSFRVGVSQLLVVRALAEVSSIPSDVISHRLMGSWEPNPAFFQKLLSADSTDADHSRPYPFFLSHPLEEEPRSLGPVTDWQIEWKWDGIRAQVIRRNDEPFVWSRGEELVTDRFPEIRELARELPDGTAIDGEILCWRSGEVQPFAHLQKRIGRKSVGKKLLLEAPVVLMAYDLLESNGWGLRDLPLQERRRLLEEMAEQIDHPSLQLSPRIEAASWEDLTELRESSRLRQVEGVMLKRLNSPYRVGRVRGDWWKWKVDPYSIDAVLIYAQQGHGKRSGLFSDYTFGVWEGDRLVPFAKAYSGLTDAELRRVDAFIRTHTEEKFGPVRTVTPELVFEIGFEGIQASTRHKSGVAVRFPRMLRWRTDKKPQDANTLEQVRQLLPQGTRT